MFSQSCGPGVWRPGLGRAGSFRGTPRDSPPCALRLAPGGFLKSSASFADTSLQGPPPSSHGLQPCVSMSPLFPSLLRTCVIESGARPQSRGTSSWDPKHNHICRDPCIHRFWGLGLGHVWWRQTDTLWLTAVVTDFLLNGLTMPALQDCYKYESKGHTQGSGSWGPGTEEWLLTGTGLLSRVRKMFKN